MQTEHMAGPLIGKSTKNFLIIILKAHRGHLHTIYNAKICILF